MSMKQENSFFKSLQKDRFKFFGNYKIDRFIVNICMFSVFIFLFFVAYINNFELDYYNCIRGDTILGNYCENPFYEPVTWKNNLYLPPGEYGNKPGLLFKSIWLVTFSIFFVGFVINHLIYNRGRKIENN